MKSNHYAINTIGTRLRHLRAVFNHAIENKQPTDFPFYRIPASLLDTLDVFTDMLRHPEDNKAFIDLYKINPNDYPILEQESPSETAQQFVAGFSPGQSAAGEQSATGQQPTDGQQPVTEQQAQPLGFESRVDWEQLARLGITRQSLEQSGDLSAVLSGGKSGLVTISTEIEGIPITTQGRIHFQESTDGKLDLKIDCYRRESALDLPFHGVLLDKETRDNILATGNAGHPVLLPLDGGNPKPCLISLDKLTNNLVAVPVDDILIPMEIKGVTLTPEQHRQLSEGGKVLIEGMDSQWKSKFDAYMQYNVAKEKFDYNFDGLDRNRYKKIEQQQKASTAQTDGVKFFIPKKLLGKELTPRTAGEIRQDGDYLRHRHERPGRATVQCLCPHEPRPGQARLLPLQSRQSQKSGKGNHPHSRPQDTGSGEQRCNRRSHQACATTAETSGGTTGASRSRKAGGEERSEEKECQRKKIIKT